MSSQMEPSVKVEWPLVLLINETVRVIYYACARTLTETDNKICEPNGNNKKGPCDKLGPLLSDDLDFFLSLFRSHWTLANYGDKQCFDFKDFEIFNNCRNLENFSLKKTDNRNLLHWIIRMGGT